MSALALQLLESHDLRLVALATVVCALSAFAGITLIAHARRTHGPMHLVWLAIAAIAVGFGIWATHFIAMLAFSAGMPTGYDLPITLVSLAVAIAIVGGGLWFATVGDGALDAMLGGMVVGVGIAAMHYVGMAALLLGGRITWDPSLVAASLLLGMGLGAAAMLVGTRHAALRGRLAGAVLLTMAIVSMHFSAMAAIGLGDCFAIVTEADRTPEWLSLVVATVSALILLMALGGIGLDLRERRRAAAEAERMRALADAAVEGLIVCRAGRVVTANASFLELAGLTQDAIAGRPLESLLSPTACTALAEHPGAPLETELALATGGSLSVEVIQRPVSFDGAPHVVVAVRDLTARRQAEQHIRYLAHHDHLTGLPNRARFSQELEAGIAHARRRGQTLAVLCIDLDRFKEVNDLFGHPAGDALLQRVGAALQATIGKRGLAARLGGDEFAIILADRGTPESAAQLADAVFDAFRRDNGSVTTGPGIGASIGIALFPDTAADAEQLMLQADTALYRAKQEGRNTRRFYHAQMGAELRDRLALERDLRLALEGNQLRVVYQPQVDIRSGRLTGFEALLRWTHPERGEISPADFIPIAEESGLILQIGEWVLGAAAREAARWTAPLEIAVNVSAVQIHAAGFVGTLRDILARSGLDPSRLEIEITETALVRDAGRAAETLEAIRALGIRVAMDDFGTGYSSLANLRTFRFSRLKVDRSFIRDVDHNRQSAAIVRAVLGLGAGLDIPVVAEGVERQEELDFLRRESCASVQGFLIGRPQGIEHFAEQASGRRAHLDGGARPPLRVVG